MKVYCGNIITCDKDNNVYRYLVEDNGRILYVGDELPEIYETTERIELNGQALIPTFCDTHSHFASYAVLSSALILNGLKSNAEMIKLIAEENLRIKPNKTIIAFGASPNVKEGRMLNREELDKAAPNRHIVVIGCDGHSLVLNTKTILKLPKNIKDVRGYDSESGVIKHEAFYRVVDFLPKLLKKKDIIGFLQHAIDTMALKGFGMVHAASGTGFPKDLDVDLLKWIARGQDNGFQMRIFFQTFDTDKVLKRGFPRLGGCFKTALDGSITSRDAAVIKPYENTDNYGILFYTDEELYLKCLNAHKLNLQIEMHAIGDAAFDQATRIYKRILDEYPRPDHRHGIIHASLITEEGLKILKDYNIQILAQPAFIDMTGMIFEPMLKALGDRIYDAEPHRKFLDGGIIMSAGSDAPVTMPEPIEWMYKACNNPNTVNRMSILEALKVCTYNGYWASFDEKERGSLEAGKIADMVILSENPYIIPAQELMRLQVIKTILGGREFQAGKRSIIKTIIKGMMRRTQC